MRLFTSFTSIVAGVMSFSTTTHALIGAKWSMTDVPSTGLRDITFPITIIEADRRSGYYFAQQYAFVGSSSGGYTGLQPRPDSGGRPVLHAVFSSFVNASKTADANCHAGADGGPGVSCSVEWAGVYGRTYDLEVKAAGNQVWVGTVVDTVTGGRIHIGSYTLPANAGGIESSESGFVEWYPWNSGQPANHCARLPYQQTIFGSPRTTNVGSIGTENAAYEYGDCVGQVRLLHSKDPPREVVDSDFVN
ncbi:hypothetical protein C8R43DRAFT_1180406 [Mycena crocata]|nr:hypothetical protein C8R43DRAFT_1180406 [Mycena crocata]